MLLEEILINLGTETKQPPLPKGGVPRQWLPAFIRWPIRLTILPFVWMDTLSQKLAKKIIRPPYKRVGQCKKRGNCCHYIFIQKLRGPFSRVNLFWQTQINGFYLRDKKTYSYNGKKVYVVGCRYLSKEGRCTRHFFRPVICRNWPRIEIFGEPEVLKGCGFHAELRKSRQKMPKNSKLPIL